MKIINPGKYNNITYRFHCVRCDCVYEVAERELQYSDELAFPRYRYTHCPMCGNEIPSDYAEIVDDADTRAEPICDSETKSDSTENGCEKCAYLGSSNFCMILGKTLKTVACDRYKSRETNIIERSELTKLRVSVKFLQKYCENKHSCTGCPFSGSMDEGCRLAKTPELWNTDL